MGVVVTIAGAVRHWRRGWLAVTLGGIVAFPLLQVALLALRFHALPNYATWYDWPANVARILRTTPSILDVPAIVADEWLLEVGYMNFAYGRGISEWSFALLPTKLVAVAVIAALTATNAALLRRAGAHCGRPAALAAGATTGGGAFAGMLASVTMASVACCAAVPSWITALTTIGLGLSTAFWLRPAGPWLVNGSIALLTLTMLLLAWRISASASARGRPRRWRKSWPLAS
jgi:hypothetical protein